MTAYAPIFAVNRLTFEHSERQILRSIFAVADRVGVSIAAKTLVGHSFFLVRNCLLHFNLQCAVLERGTSAFARVIGHTRRRYLVFRLVSLMLMLLIQIGVQSSHPRGRLGCPVFVVASLLHILGSILITRWRLFKGFFHRRNSLSFGECTDQVRRGDCPFEVSQPRRHKKVVLRPLHLVNARSTRSHGHIQL